MTKTWSDFDDDDFSVVVKDVSSGLPIKTVSQSKTPSIRLVNTANLYTRSLVRVYIEKFGMNVMDVRMVGMLAREPDSTVTVLAEMLGVDKAAVSRSVMRLEEDGHATGTGKSRKGKVWRLTRSGYDLHSRVYPVLIERQKKLLKGMSAQDVQQFNAYLEIIRSNLEAQ